jgi:hypothetical protein
MRAGVRVSAHDKHSGLRQAKLRADDVHDALIVVPQRELANTELSAVVSQNGNLVRRHRVRDRAIDVLRRYVVVLGSKRQLGAPHGPASIPKALEGLRTADFMHEVHIDVKEIRCPRGTAHSLLVPDLLDERRCHGACSHVFRFQSCIARKTVS